MRRGRSEMDEPDGPKELWEPMTLTYLGDVVKLVQQAEPPGKGLSPGLDEVGKKPPGI
jgi:hypothetical protein